MQGVAALANSVRGERSIIHSHQQHIDGVVAVHALVVEALDARLPGYLRRFDLSHLCQEGNERSPDSMRQIVDPALSEESRLDALKTLVAAICKVSPYEIRGEEVISASAKGESHRRDAATDIVCSIRPALSTTLAQLFDGMQSRSFAVYRGEERIVEFTVEEKKGEIKRAAMRIVRAQLDLPLLDKHGAPATVRTINNAINDFYSLLRDSTHLSVRRSLESVALELDRRRADASRKIQAVKEAHGQSSPSFLKDLSKALEIAARKAHRIARSPLLSSPPFDFDKEALWTSQNLGDGRSLWVGLSKGNSRAERTHIHIVGNTGSNLPYKVSVDCPSWLSLAVRRVRGILNSSRTPLEAVEAIEKLTELPSAGVKYEVPSDPTFYPREVNALIENTRARFGTDSIGRGMLLGYDSRRALPAIGSLHEFLGGRERVPIWGVAPADDVAYRWAFQGFVDENMRGRLFCSTPLGANLILHFKHEIIESSGVISSDIAQTLEVLYTAPEKFVSHVGKLSRVLEGYWQGSHQIDMSGRGILCDVANSLNRAFERADLFADGYLSRVSPWMVYPLPSGRWALSINARSRDGREDVPVSVLVGSSVGVEEFLVSAGERSRLGRLQGTLLLPRGAEIFDKHQLQGIVRFLCMSVSYSDSEILCKRLDSCVPSADRLPGVAMGLFDPRVDEKDVVRRALNWVKQIFT